MRVYSVYYIPVGSSTCFACLHPSSGTRITVSTASGTGQLGLLPPARVVALECQHSKHVELSAEV